MNPAAAFHVKTYAMPKYFLFFHTIQPLWVVLLNAKIKGLINATYPLLYSYLVLTD